jgi:hypothetical protein
MVVAPVGNRVSTGSRSPTQQDGPSDPKRGPLVMGLTLTTGLRGAISAETHPGMLALGMTPELKSQCVDQMITSEWRMDMPLYFVWARKSLEFFNSRL